MLVIDRNATKCLLFTQMHILIGLNKYKFEKLTWKRIKTASHGSSVVKMSDQVVQQKLPLSEFAPQKIKRQMLFAFFYGFTLLE